MHRHHSLFGFVFGLAAATLAAQQPLPAKAYLPVDYTNVVFADLARLRSTGVWEDLQASVLKVVLAQMEKETGFPLAALDRVTMAAESPVGGGMDLQIRQVYVFEGNAPLGVPDSVKRGRWGTQTVGEQEVYARQGGNEWFFCPRPEVQVAGSSAVLEPVLTGKRQAGLPAADILSLLSGRGEHLAYLALHVGSPLLRENVIDKVFPGTEWPADDAPTYVLLRVRTVGEAEDPHLELEAVLRHGKIGDGLPVTEAAVEAWLAKAKKDPQWLGWKPLWGRLAKQRSGADVSLRVDLGRPREAVGYLALLAAPILSPRTVQAEAPKPKDRE